MIQERKRFNYLSTQQRTLNTLGNVQASKTYNVGKTQVPVAKQNKYESKYNQSETKGQSYGCIAQQSYNSNSRRSSIARNTPNVEPLGDSTFMLSNQKNINSLTNACQSNQKNTQRKSLQSSRLSNNCASKSKYNNIFSSIPSNLQPTLPQVKINSSTKNNLIEQTAQKRIKQLQKQNELLLKNQQQKYMQMFTHLQKVQKILKQKQSIIENLKRENQTLSKRHEEDRKIEEDRVLQKNEKQFDLNEVNCYEEIETQTQILEASPKKVIKTLPSVNSFQSQTQLTSHTIEQMQKKLTKSQQQDPSKISYRQKYQTLFKKALQMQDQIYRLKQQLFDSQTQVKTLQQQFNTYKILNQIEKNSSNKKCE